MNSIDICGYRHNYEVFYEKYIYQIFINKGRMIITQGAHASLIKILSFLLFFIRQELEEKIQPSNDHVDIARG